MQKLPDVKSLCDRGYEIPPASDIPSSLLVSGSKPIHPENVQKMFALTQCLK